MTFYERKYLKLQETSFSKLIEILRILFEKIMAFNMISDVKDKASAV